MQNMLKRILLLINHLFYYYYGLLILYFLQKSSTDKEVIDAEKEACDAADAANVIYDQGGAPISSSTKIFNVVHTPVNTVDDEIPELVEINNDNNYGIFTHSSYDDENWDFQNDMVEGAIADNNNMDTSNVVSSIPTTRVHSFHPKTQIIGDPSSAVQTRSKIEAMQEELLQFKIQKVWVLVDFPYGKKAIGTKWVYRNKKDKRGVVVKNKARLVAQGHRQEEGIDYDEVFDHVARIEAIRIFLAFASFMGFIVYQMDVKSAFLYGTIEEEVYMSQPSGFIDPKFPNKVYKVQKALYGLHQAPRAWYATLSTFLLKSGFRRGTIDKTLFIKKDKKDIMLVQFYVDDIIFGSIKKSWCDEFKALMKSRFQMSSMGELTFFLGLQVKQKEDGIFLSQDKYVAEILKKFDFENVPSYSKELPHPKCCEKDYSNLKGANLDRKSTTGGCQFLGKRLISWQCKKQTIMATSTTKAESSMFKESTISIVKNPVYHSKTKHIEIRHHFIRDSYEKKLIQVLKIHTDDNVADLLTKAFDGPRFNFLVMANLKYSDKHNMVTLLKKPNGSDDFHEIVYFLKRNPLRYALTYNLTIYDSLVKQFWQTATVRTIATGNQELLATIDSKAYTITEASVRSSIQLADATGITNLPDAEIHEGLATMGITDRQEPEIPQSQGPTPTPIADEATTTSVEVNAEGASTTTASLKAGLDSGNIHESPLRSHDAPLPKVNISGSAKDNVQLKELMELAPKLVLRIDSLEKELTKTTQIFGNEVLTLKNRVKTLEVALKRKSKKVVLSESEGEEAENSSKQGRKSQDDRSEDFITPSKIGCFWRCKLRLRDKKAKMVEENVQSVQKTKKQLEQEKAGLQKVSVASSIGCKILKLQRQRIKEYSGNFETVTIIKETKALLMISGLLSSTKKDAAKDVPVTEEKAGETTVPKEEEDAREDSETDKEEDMEAIGAIPVATKSPSVVNWKIFQQGQISIYQIIRANGADTIYMSFRAMLKDITRDDLTELYKLVMQKYGANRPEDVYDRVLWSDLRTMFESPLIEDAIWSLLLQQKMLNWRYYVSCGVHCLTLEAAIIYMLTERKYPLSSDACKAMLDMKLQGGKQNEEFNLCLHKLAITLNRLERSIHWDQQIGVEILVVGDRWRWTLGEDGDFKVKILKSLIEEKILQVENNGHDTRWNKLVPKKVNVFVWRAIKGRLPVRVELERRGIDLDSVLCAYCNDSVETCTHCLVTCDLAMSV
ncbi:putative ribonuclease H-like domain-containing protein [Tanacetum coccineum]